MLANRITDVYENGVEEFIEFAKQNDRGAVNGKHRCPCVNCLNGIFQKVDDIR